MLEFSPSFLTFLVALVGGLMIIILALISQFRGQVVVISDDRNRQPSSPLGEHIKDDAAHEPMRDRLWEKLDERFEELERAIAEATRQREAERAEYRNMIEQALAQNERVIEQLRITHNQQHARGNSPVIPLRER